MSLSFPELMKNEITNPRNKTHPKQNKMISIPRHIIAKLQNTEDREKNYRKAERKKTEGVTA